jgi:DNA-binding CsgD family transcriptional regulator
LRLSGARRAFFFISAGNEDQVLRLEASGGAMADSEPDHIIWKIAALALKKQRTIQSGDITAEKYIVNLSLAIQDVTPFICIPVSFRKNINTALYLDNSDSSFDMPDDTYTVINALIIQAVTEIVMNSGTPAGKAEIDHEKFSNICGQFRISNKEKQVLMLLLMGYTKKQIAGEQSISINTVKHHISNIYEKTGAGSRAELSELITGKTQD